MQATKTLAFAVLRCLMMLGIALVPFATLQGNASAQKSGDREWSVQVEEVNSGEVNLDPAFRVAIYENLLSQLEETSKFENIYRSGDRLAESEPDLLILKVNVRKFDAGSETKRAVTTVAGATKLKVQYQLETRDGRVVSDNLVEANVRFFGSNLRVTHNLAHNIAGVIKKSTLPKSTTGLSDHRKATSRSEPSSVQLNSIVGFMH